MSLFSMYNMWFGTPSVANCRQARRAVQSYLDNELGERDVSRVSAHLKICKRCGLEVDTYRSIKQSLRQQAAVDDAAVQRLREFGTSLNKQRADSGEI